MHCKAIIKEFVIYLILISFICAFILVMKTILYKNEEKAEYVIITSENISRKYYGKIKEGDPLIDSVTKRQIGIVEELDILIGDGNFKAVIRSYASIDPSSKALVCSGLWFPYTYERECDKGLSRSTSEKNDKKALTACTPRTLTGGAG